MTENAYDMDVSITGCARCHGEGHDDLRFEPLTHPHLGREGIVFTHWAPTNGEPILLAMVSTSTEREL